VYNRKGEIEKFKERRGRKLEWASYWTYISGSNLPAVSRDAGIDPAILFFIVDK